SAKTREVKLGCVFLQTEADKEGHPIRKEESTSYIGSFEQAAEFGLLLRQEARRRGLARAAKIVFIGDGAAWIWELARVNFPGAILILDFYHALQHVHGLVDALWGEETPEGKKTIKLWKRWLLKGKASQILAQAKEPLDSVLDTEAARKEIGYLENNLERMTYGAFRKAGYFIGSGVVEAGCKTVIGKRMKCSGMFWSEEGGQGVLDLRCALLSNRLDAFCQARATAQLAQICPVKLAA
ncbi:MAG TPA: ISKra4 family transposase, partial [Verrucomicrobiae bacterium]|nr:ISKra4 family transposase [Verrucomicrobiae bacterium]